MINDSVADLLVDAACYSHEKVVVVVFNRRKFLMILSMRDNGPVLLLAP